MRRPASNRRTSAVLELCPHDPRGDPRTVSMRPAHCRTPPQLSAPDCRDPRQSLLTPGRAALSRPQLGRVEPVWTHYWNSGRCPPRVVLATLAIRRPSRGLLSRAQTKPFAIAAGVSGSLLATECQGTDEFGRRRTAKLDGDGHEIWTLADIRTGRLGSSASVGRRKRLDTATVESLGEPVAAALGDDDVGVVEKPIHGRGGKTLGEDRVEFGRVEV